MTFLLRPFSSFSVFWNAFHENLRMPAFFRIGPPISAAPVEPWVLNHQMA